MARSIQSEPGRLQPNIGAFVGGLLTAVFWLVAASVVPVEAIGHAFPEIAPYAPWAPVLFYALAFWSFIRAVRILQRLAAGRSAAPLRAKPPLSARAQHPPEARKDKTKANTGLPVNRTPTVQRMR